MKTKSFFALAIAFAFTLCAQAQNPASGTGVPASGGDRIEQFRQKMNEYLKTALKVSDEEWSIIQPLLETVQTKQREALMNRFSFMSNRRNKNPAAHSDKPSSPETDALRAALETEGATPAEIKSRLDAVRAASKKAAIELELAREELRKVLTQRQEATLVMVGILE